MLVLERRPDAPNLALSSFAECALCMACGSKAGRARRGPCGKLARDRGQ